MRRITKVTADAAHTYDRADRRLHREERRPVQTRTEQLHGAGWHPGGVRAPQRDHDHEVVVLHRWLTQSRLRIVSSVAPVASTPDINDRGKVLGWNLAPAETAVETVTGAGPEVRTCPEGFALVPRTNTSTVETVSGLHVNGKQLQTRPVRFGRLTLAAQAPVTDRPGLAC